MELADERCSPALAIPLTPAVKSELASALPEWTIENSAVEREFTFPDFKSAMAFVNGCATVAEQEDHHPDIAISYRNVHITLSTHAVKDLTRNDFIMAAKIERVSGEATAPISIPHDHIMIRDLDARCIIGTTPRERAERQDVLVSIVLHTDLKKSGASDSLADTIDFRDLKKRVLAMVEGSSFSLAEALAEAVANICLNEPQVPAVTVRVEKPGALRFVRHVGVEITRSRR